MGVYLATKNTIYDNSSDIIKTILTNIFGNNVNRTQDNIYFHQYNIDWDSTKDYNIFDLEIWLYGMNPDDFCLILVSSKTGEVTTYGNNFQFGLSINDTLGVITPFVIRKDNLFYYNKQSE